MAKMKVDFTNVSESGGVAVGRHIAKVVDITKEQGDEYPYLKWDLVVVSGVSKGLHINHITSLKPSALFNLRNTLVSLGLDVPKSALSFDTDALKGKTLGIEVFLKESDGKEYSNIKKTFLPEKSVGAKPAKAVETVAEDDMFDADGIDLEPEDDDDELEL